MARNPVTVDRIRGGVSDVVGKAVDATVYLPLGIYDRARDQLTELDATRVRETFNGLIGDFIDRGEDRVQPLERRLRREGRKLEAGVNETVSDVKRTTRKVKKTTARAKKTTRTTAKKGTARASAGASNAEPKLPRVTAPRTTGELPIASYGKLTAEEIAQRLTGLTQTELAKVYKYEKAHENRATILNSVEGKLVDLPIPTYDALTVDEITRRLESLNDSELRTIKSYESGTKRRATVIEKIDAQLA